MKQKKPRYRKDLPKKLYTFFITYQDSGAPSFHKFARSIGSTVEQLNALREHSEFDRAWRECIEIRRDYLIDAALTRRHDPSFVKFLLSEELSADTESDERDIAVSISVCEK